MISAAEYFEEISWTRVWAIIYKELELTDASWLGAMTVITRTAAMAVIHDADMKIYYRNILLSALFSPADFTRQIDFANFGCSFRLVAAIADYYLQKATREWASCQTGE